MTLSREEPLQEIRAAIQHLTETLPGWCPLEKALTLAELVLQSRARIVIEVGVYGGRSLFPMAHALRAQEFGMAYGIDPYSNEVATALPVSAADDMWWARVDLAAIKRLMLAYMSEQELSQHCALVELSSDEAFAAFRGPRFDRAVDLVHIDGAHSPLQAMRDAVNWSTLLRPNGALVIDDVNWPTLDAVRRWANSTHRVVCEVSNEGGSYGIYRRPG